MDAKSERAALVESLKEGDVIKWNGTLRIIRDVTQGTGKGHRRRCYTLAILRCSWTRKPFTVYTGTALRNLNKSLTLVARNYKDKTALGELLQEDVKRRNAAPSVLECCDVIGVIR